MAKPQMEHIQWPGYGLSLGQQQVWMGEEPQVGSVAPGVQAENWRGGGCCFGILCQWEQCGCQRCHCHLPEGDHQTAAGAILQ